MNYFQILNCSSSLGNCCTNKGIASLISIISNIIQLVQIIVPIMLLIMVAVNLTQLVLDPEDKKKIKSIKTKFFAALFVFAVPVIVNAFILMIDNSGTSSFSVIGCIEESKNIKITSKPTYSSTRQDERKTIMSGSKDYEPGNKRASTDENGNVTPGEKITAGEAIIGDSGVKVRENIYHKHSAINRKLNNMDVVNYALSWKGKMSYKFGSTGELRPGGTCDCSHFVYKVFQHFGAVEGDWIYCSVWGSGNVKGTTLYSDPSKLVPGDVVYKYYSKYAQHVEIYLGNNRSVGCNGGKGVNEGGNVKKYFDTFIHINAYD